MKKITYGIYGASGFGKEILPLLKQQVLSDTNIYFIDDSSALSNINGHEVISFEKFITLDTDEFYISVAVANSDIRQTLSEKCISHNISLIDIKAKNIVIMDNVTLSKGSILCPFVTLTSNINIGKSFHANIYSYIAHDCIIGDYVTFAPSVKCNGNVIIEDHVYIGTGTIIHQGKPNKPLKIGKGATIAAGSVITKSVPAGMTVFGNPAIELTKENLRRRK